jgi:hypothetical protein
VWIFYDVFVLLIAFLVYHIHIYRLQREDKPPPEYRVQFGLDILSMIAKRGYCGEDETNVKYSTEWTQPIRQHKRLTVKLALQPLNTSLFSSELMIFKGCERKFRNPVSRKPLLT